MPPVRKTVNFKTTPTSSTTINNLPDVLLIEIFGRVASNSSKDLFNLKLISKDFLAATEDKHVYRNISMNKIPIIRWVVKEQESSFIRCCEENENPEALYKQGMLDYFGSEKQESGLEFLRKSADKNHVDALYVYGVILFSSGDQQKQNKSLKILSFFKNSKMRSSCRNRIKEVLKSMWIQNSVSYDKKMDDHSKICEGDQAIKEGLKGWPSEELNATECEYCIWNHEVHLFSGLF